MSPRSAESVDTCRLCHRLRNPVQRDVEDGKAVLANRKDAKKAMHPEFGIQEEAHDRGCGLPARRRNTSNHGGQCAGHVNADETSICREIPMDAGLRVAVAVDELALLMDAQDQGVCHEDVVDRDINLVTLQVRGESGTEKPMALSLEIQKKPAIRPAVVMPWACVDMVLEPLNQRSSGVRNGGAHSVSTGGAQTRPWAPWHPGRRPCILARNSSMIPFMINEGATDRRDRGLGKPWGSTGRHAIVLNEPEQLRGPRNPHLQGWASKEVGMSNAPVFAGIDVSNAQLGLALRPGEGCSIPHDEAGLTGIVERLRALSPTLIVLEATGGLELPLTGALAAAGLPVVVVNPRQVRDFAKATGTLAKIDTLDARSWRTSPR